MNFFSTTYCNNKKGFTLIELLVVISIIGVLSTVAMTSLNAAKTKAKRAKAQVTVKELHQILLRYNLDNNNTWPSTCNNIDTVAEWNGAWNTYAPGVTADPWGTTYFFDGCPNVECTAGGSSICSAGPNKVFESHNRTDMKAISDDVCIYFTPEC